MMLTLGGLSFSVYGPSGAENLSLTFCFVCRGRAYFFENFGWESDA